jgi:hypothetical protein
MSTYFLPKSQATKDMDLGFEIRNPEKTYSGSRVKKAPDPGSGSAILDLSEHFVSENTFWRFSCLLTPLQINMEATSQEEGGYVKEEREGDEKMYPAAQFLPSMFASDDGSQPPRYGIS